jgi:hypothetical protein
MNLYSVRAADGKTVKDSGFFATKAEAKVARDELNGGTTADLLKEDKKPKFFVAKGPEHIHFRG